MNIVCNDSHHGPFSPRWPSIVQKKGREDQVEDRVMTEIEQLFAEQLRQRDRQASAIEHLITDSHKRSTKAASARRNHFSEARACRR